MRYIDMDVKKLWGLQDKVLTWGLRAVIGGLIICLIVVLFILPPEFQKMETPWGSNLLGILIVFFVMLIFGSTFIFQKIIQRTYHKAFAVQMAYNEVEVSISNSVQYIAAIEQAADGYYDEEYLDEIKPYDMLEDDSII